MSEEKIISFKTSVLMVKNFVLVSPGSLLISLTLLLLAGLAEGIGFIALLPLLEMATQETAQGALAETIFHTFSYFNLKPSIGLVLAVLVTGMCTKAALTLLAQRNIGYTVASITANLRLLIVSSLLKANWLKFVSQKSGRISNAVGTETTVTAAAYGAMMSLFAMLLQVIVFVFIALSTSWQVTLAGLLVGSCIIISLRNIVRFARSAGTQNINKMNSLIQRLTDGILLIKPLKAMGQEFQILPQLKLDINAIKSSQRKLTIAASALNVVQEPIVTMFLAVGLYVAISFLNFTLSELLFLMILFHRIVTRISGLQVQYQKLASQESAYWSAKGLIEDFLEDPEAYGGDKLEVSFNHELKFENVTFRYPENSTDVLDNLNLSILSKKLIVITGGSGTGKTTLIDLLVGLLKPTSGIISIDGTSLLEMDKLYWRKSIGYVPQEPILFHQTIRENVTLNNKTVNENELMSALEMSGMLEMVNSLPEGVETDVGERGAKLSGGQRQRLCLARALIRKPSLLILDEPTAALDRENEKLICETLKSLSEMMSVVVVSHQDLISEIADVIVNLDNRTS